MRGGGGVIPFRGSDQTPQGEDLDTQQGRLSLIKSLPCQMVSDLAKRDQRNFNHDIDCTDLELEKEIVWFCSLFEKCRKKLASVGFYVL